MRKNFLLIGKIFPKKEKFFPESMIILKNVTNVESLLRWLLLLFPEEFEADLFQFFEGG